MLDGRAVQRFADALTPHMPVRRHNWIDKPPISISMDRGRYTRVHLGGVRAYAAGYLLLPFIKGTNKGDQVTDSLLEHAYLAGPVRDPGGWKKRRTLYGPSGVRHPLVDL